MLSLPCLRPVPRPPHWFSFSASFDASVHCQLYQFLNWVKRFRSLLCNRDWVEFVLFTAAEVLLEGSTVDWVGRELTTSSSSVLTTSWTFEDVEEAGTIGINLRAEDGSLFVPCGLRRTELTTGHFLQFRWSMVKKPSDEVYFYRLWAWSFGVCRTRLFHTMQLFWPLDWGDQRPMIRW